MVSQCRYERGRNQMDFNMLDSKFGAAAIAALVSFIICCITNYVQNRNAKAEVAVKYITDRRVEWIENVRKTVSEYVSVVQSMEEMDTVQIRDILGKVNQISAYLKLLLNFVGQIDEIILEIMANIVDELQEDKPDFERIHSLLELLIQHTQIYLKIEWNRVKWEVKGRRYGKKYQRKETIELYEKMANPRDIEELGIEYTLGEIKKNE